MIGHGVLFTEETLTVAEIYFVTDSRLLPIKSSTEENPVLLQDDIQLLMARCPVLVFDRLQLRSSNNLRRSTRCIYLLRLSLNDCASKSEHERPNIHVHGVRYFINCAMH